MCRSLAQKPPDFLSFGGLAPATAGKFAAGGVAGWGCAVADCANCLLAGAGCDAATAGCFEVPTPAGEFAEGAALPAGKAAFAVRPGAEGAAAEAAALAAFGFLLPGLGGGSTRPVNSKTG